MQRPEIPLAERNDNYFTQSPATTGLEGAGGHYDPNHAVNDLRDTDSAQHPWCLLSHGLGWGFSPVPSSGTAELLMAKSGVWVCSTVPLSHQNTKIWQIKTCYTFEVMFWICYGETCVATRVPSLIDKALNTHMEMQQRQSERNGSSHKRPHRSKLSVSLWCPFGVPLASKVRKLKNAQIQGTKPEPKFRYTFRWSSSNGPTTLTIHSGF